MKSFEHIVTCLGGGLVLTTLNVIFGKMDYSITFLILAMCMDFATGMLSGAMEGHLSSKICTKGLCKKLIILLYVVLAHHLDVLLNVDYIRMAVCYLYICGEVLSIIENGTKLGVPIPEPIKKALDIIDNGGE